MNNSIASICLAVLACLFFTLWERGVLKVHTRLWPDRLLPGVTLTASGSLFKESLGLISFFCVWGTFRLFVFGDGFSSALYPWLEFASGPTGENSANARIKLVLGSVPSFVRAGTLVLKAHHFRWVCYVMVIIAWLISLNRALKGDARGKDLVYLTSFVLFIGTICTYPAVWINNDLIHAVIQLYPWGDHWAIKARVDIMGPDLPQWTKTPRGWSGGSDSLLMIFLFITLSLSRLCWGSVGQLGLLFLALGIGAMLTPLVVYLLGAWLIYFLVSVFLHHVPALSKYGFLEFEPGTPPLKIVREYAKFSYSKVSWAATQLVLIYSVWKIYWG